MDRRHILPISCNLALRKATVIALGGFHPLLGRRGNDFSIMGGEETKVIAKMLERNLAVVIEPTAIVTRLIAESRLDRKYFMSLADGFVKERLMFVANQTKVQKMGSVLRSMLEPLLYLPKVFFNFVIGVIRIRFLRKNCNYMKSVLPSSIHGITCSIMQSLI
jgi:hypothetical protein